MSETNNLCVLATDFDGTVIKKDFFWYIIDKVLTEKDIEPWQDYQTGKITHFDGLNRIFQKIRISTEDLHRLIFEIPLEDCFIDTIKLCQKKNIHIYIISAGSDYYIKIILDALGIKDSVNIIANGGKYSPETGLVMTRPPKDSPFYSENYGVNKAGTVKYLKNKYKKVIFAGDGIPDFPAAEYADVVFARGSLLDLCKNNSVETYNLDSYCNVFNYLKNNCCCQNDDIL